jgi:hypothetical protein
MIRQRSGRRLTLLVALVLAALAAAACDVPTDGQPVVDRTIANGANGAGDVRAAAPPQPTDFTDDAAKFVDGYLAAIAGLAPSDQVTAASRFMDSKYAATWVQGAKAPITVVRGTPEVVGSQRDTSAPQTVSGTFQVIGLFDPATGILSPAPGPPRVKLTFQTSRTGGDVYFKLRQAPSTLLMSDDALKDDRYYQPQVVYSWASDAKRSNLIPDIRYVRTSLFATPGRAAHEIVNSVLNGDASGWISDAVAPPTTPKLQLSDAVALPVQGDHYQVDLVSSTAAALTSTDFTNLNYQLRWSLGLNHPNPEDVSPSPVDILVGGLPRLTDTPISNAFIQNVSNLAPLQNRSHWVRYVVSNGRVVLWDSTTQPGTAAPSQPAKPTKLPEPKVLKIPQNQGVISAAVTSGESAAAVVRRASGGTEELWISRMVDTKATAVRVSGLPKSGLTRPQFMLTSPGFLTVASGGHLYVIGPDNKPVQVTVAEGAPPVDAYSVGPDGRRVAYVSRGKLYMAVLTNVETHPTLTAPHQINVAPELATVSVVSWASIRQLQVAGHTPGGAAEVDTYNADGAGVNARPAIPNMGPGVALIEMSTYVYDPLLFANGTTSPILLQTSAGIQVDHKTNDGLDGVPTPVAAPFFQD